MKSKLLRRPIAALMAGALVAMAAPFSTLAHGVSTHPSAKHPIHIKATYGQASIRFGVEGGNMRPWSVGIDSNGNVTGNDYRKPANSHLYDGKNAVTALQKLADAESFGSMSSPQQCGKSLPDVAYRFVEITTSSGTHKVDVRGFCNSQFNELWSLLASVAGFAPGT